MYFRSIYRHNDNSDVYFIYGKGLFYIKNQTSARGCDSTGKLQAKQ